VLFPILDAGNPSKCWVCHVPSHSLSQKNKLSIEGACKFLEVIFAMTFQITSKSIIKEHWSEKTIGVNLHFILCHTTQRLKYADSEGRQLDQHISFGTAMVLKVKDDLEPRDYIIL
jgi:hypothetical protein